jgi:hypothetical protein
MRLEQSTIDREGIRIDRHVFNVGCLKPSFHEHVRSPSMLNRKVDQQQDRFVLSTDIASLVERALDRAGTSIGCDFQEDLFVHQAPAICGSKSPNQFALISDGPAFGRGFVYLRWKPG